MFKTSKLAHSDTPSTPKLGSVSLPGDNDPKMKALKRAPTPERKPTKTSIFAKMIPDRPMTPFSGLRMTPRESKIGGQYSRTRTVSLASGIPDAPLKPPKVTWLGPPKPTVPVSSKASGSESFKSQQPVCYAASGSSSIVYPMKRSSSYVPAGQHIAPPKPPREPRSQSYHHNMNPNVAEPHLSNARVDRTPKYMKATMKEVPLKQEAIALSWPLVEYARRRHTRTPLLHFDVGFDPRSDDWNIRANRGGYSTPLTRQEQEIPVSTHCGLSKMVIHCRFLEPVVVKRERGLRCIDVFRAIYDKYHEPLTQSDLERLGEYIDRCKPAFEQRCKDSPGLALYNQRRGMRRVDLLRGRRIFKGLTQAPESDTDWVLHFDEPER